MTYSLTNFTSISTVQDMLESANTAGSNLLFAGLDVMLFFIFFISMLNFGIEVSFIGACFIALIIAFFLAYMSLVAWWFVGIWAGLTLFSIIYIMWSNRYD